MSVLELETTAAVTKGTALAGPTCSDGRPSAPAAAGAKRGVGN